MKRGQSALEYLVTYGWAILAIVIVAAVLWYFGIFNPSKWSSSKQCGGFASFTCIDYTTTTAGNVTAILGNNVGRSINITAPVACRQALIAATATFSCNFNTTGNSGDQVSLQVNYTDVKSGLTHTETGFAKLP